MIENEDKSNLCGKAEFSGGARFLKEKILSANICVNLRPIKRRKERWRIKQGKFMFVKSAGRK
jgi:hypothetical protein